MSFLIRRAKHEDAPQIIDSHVRSIRTFCSKDYNPEQIEAWAGRKFSVPRWCDTIDRDLVWVIEVDSNVRGFGHFHIGDNQIGEVMGLYFAPEARGLGAGKKLFEIFMKVARENDLKVIYASATLTAKTFYESLGFKPTSGKTEMELGGVKIPCVPMWKSPIF